MEDVSCVTMTLHPDLSSCVIHGSHIEIALGKEEEDPREKA